jgi:hypothetical protein
VAGGFSTVAVTFVDRVALVVDETIRALAKN